MVTWAVDLRGDKGASRLGRFLDRISIYPRTFWAKWFTVYVRFTLYRLGRNNDRCIQVEVIAAGEHKKLSMPQEFVLLHETVTMCSLDSSL